MNKRILMFWKKYSYVIMLGALFVGLVEPAVVLIFIICMFGPAVTGFFSGRFWCGNICPIGNFFDNVSSKASRKAKVPKVFKSLTVKIIATIVMVAMFIYDMKSALGNPNLGGFIYFKMISQSLIVGTLLTLMYSRRAWCHFCPMGSFGAIVSKFSKNKKVLQVSSNCTSCNKCASSCPMGVVPSSFKGGGISSLDCIQCSQCSKACTHKAIAYKTEYNTESFSVEKLISITDSEADRTSDSFEERFVISGILTLIHFFIFIGADSLAFKNAMMYSEKLVVFQLTSTSIVMLTCFEYFEESLVKLLKFKPDLKCVVSVGVIAWYIYELIVVYLLLTVNSGFIRNLNLMPLTIAVTTINFISYLISKRKCKIQVE